MQRLRQIGLAVVLVVVMRAGDAGAQTSAAPPPVTAGFDNGFFIQSPDGATRLTFGFVAQTDGRFFARRSAANRQHVHHSQDPADVHRTGRQVFRVQGDARFRQRHHGHPGRLLRHALLPAFRVRSRKGQDARRIRAAHWRRQPVFSRASARLEPCPEPRHRGSGARRPGWRQADLCGWTVQRHPRRNIVHHRTRHQQRQGLCRSRRGAAARRSTTGSSALNGLGFHVGGSVGTQANGLPSFRTSVGQTYFTYASGVTADGQRTRVSPGRLLFLQVSWGCSANTCCRRRTLPAAA